jgi:hypothetical protein
MLFKTAEGAYVEILRSQYTNDTAYYTSIMKNAKANEMAMANAMGANAMGANANAMGANANAMGANAMAMANAMGANATAIVANTNEMVEMDRIRSLVYKTLKHI